MVAAALFQSSAAQTTHVVGDGLGWTIPPGGPVAYSTWASRQSFAVGDILVFNFNAGAHDVAEVTKAAYDACNTTSPISMSTAAPTNITLGSAGEHYFMCTFAGHCNVGQKLAINVSAAGATSPAPQPAAGTPPPASSPTAAPAPATVPAPTPSPVFSPAPAPSRSAETYVVADGLGWNVLPGGVAPFQAWAANKTFMVGDTLVFNFANGSHNVAQVTKTAYNSCNTATTISLTSTSPARITLATAGEHFFTCTFPGHCSRGQKLAINVTGSTTATPPSPSPAISTPPSSIANPPSTPTAPSAPSPSGSTAPPSPDSSAPSFASALPVAMLSIAVALLH